MDATEHPETGGHGVAVEPDRVPIGLVVGMAAALTGMAVVAAVLMVVYFKVADRRAEKRDASVVAEAGLERREPALPPAPRLEIRGARRWTDFQTAERERLESYGWMDRSTGAVHIPIQRAIELIAERGVGPLPQAPVALPPSVQMPAAPPAPAAATPQARKGTK
jgi:hypothetical protein